MAQIWLQICPVSSKDSGGNYSSMARRVSVWVMHTYGLIGIIFNEVLYMPSSIQQEEEGLCGVEEIKEWSSPSRIMDIHLKCVGGQQSAYPRATSIYTFK